jgi:hypothetical protein
MQGTLIDIELHRALRDERRRPEQPAPRPRRRRWSAILLARAAARIDLEAARGALRLEPISYRRP